MIYLMWVSPGNSALPVTRNRRYARGEALGRCFDCFTAHRFYDETPSFGVGVDMGANWRVCFHILDVSTGSGPEGSRPTAYVQRS